MSNTSFYNLTDFGYIFANQGLEQLNLGFPAVNLLPFVFMDLFSNFMIFVCEIYVNLPQECGILVVFQKRVEKEVNFYTSGFEFLNFKFIFCGDRLV